MSFLSRLLGRSDDAKLSPAAFVDRYDGAAPVLDVRTPGEFAGGHLAGAANVDVMAPDFADRVEALGLPKDGPVYLYCRSGNRSGKAADHLRSMGYAEAINVGGFDALRAVGADVAA